MKRIKIYLLIALLMNLFTVYAQQTITDLPESDTIPESEQLSPTGFSEDQPSLLQQGEQSSIPPAPSPETLSILNTLPEEPVAPISIEDPIPGELPVAKTEPAGTESQEYTGPSEDRDPNGVKPDKK